MVGGRAANAMAGLRPHRKLLCQLVAIPVLDAAPTRPDCGGGMLSVRLPPTLLSRKERGHARRIDHPASSYFPGRLSHSHGDSLGAAILQRDSLDGGGAQKFGASSTGAVE